MDRRSIIALVGAGNIGSRHLQGLALSHLPADIHIVEPDEAATTLARQRLGQVEAGKALRFTFHRGIADLPREIDLAILATPAGPRRAITETLLAAAQVKAIVFEKFLFQTIADHDEIGLMLETRGIRAYANTPRRYWPGYQALARSVAGRGPIALLVDHDTRHGLATSLIHLIDLLAFLAGPGGRYRFDGTGLALAQDMSRHAGAIEFTGPFAGTSDRGDVLAIRPSTSTLGRMAVVLPDSVHVIDEGARTLTTTSLDGSAPPVSQPFGTLYQSQLSHLIAEDILLRGTCSLPDYAESAALHVGCLGALLEAMGLPRDDRAARCAIT